eukprot:2469211-Rhodomonas_salina.6
MIIILTSIKISIITVSPTPPRIIIIAIPTAAVTINITTTTNSSSSSSLNVSEGGEDCLSSRRQAALPPPPAPPSSPARPPLMSTLVLSHSQRFLPEQEPRTTNRMRLRPRQYRKFSQDTQGHGGTRLVVLVQKVPPSSSTTYVRTGHRVAQLRG